MTTVHLGFKICTSLQSEQWITHSQYLIQQLHNNITMIYKNMTLLVHVSPYTGYFRGGGYQKKQQLRRILLDLYLQLSNIITRTYSIL